jgi:uncharacterized sporulation protein YeaH/YhbH (DUF444 family)
MTDIIDRRLNPSGKSLGNRQRFLRRARTLVQRAVRDSFKDRSLKDLDQESEVTIVRDGVHEPSFHTASRGGDRDHLLPGNKTYVEGDTIPRPPGGGGGGAGGRGNGGGPSEDEFRFVLTREEFLDLFLDDPEMPDLAKRHLISTEGQGLQRAGYKTSGGPSSLAITRTMRNALSRRVALRRPSAEEIRRLDEEIERLELKGDEPARLLELRENRDKLERRRRVISYVDPIDLRYVEELLRLGRILSDEERAANKREAEGAGAAGDAPREPASAVSAEAAGVEPPADAAGEGRAPEPPPLP